MLSDPGGVQAYMHTFLFTHIGPGRIFIKFLFILTVPGRSQHKFTLYSLVLAELWSNFIYSQNSSDYNSQILGLNLNLSASTQFYIYTHGPRSILLKFSFILIGLDQCFVLKWIHYSQFRLHTSGSALTIIFILLYLYYIILLYLYYIIFILYYIIIFLLYLFHIIIFFTN